MSNAKKKVFEYSMYLKGLFGRNRKVKAQSFALVESETRLDDGAVLIRAQNLIATLKLRGKYGYTVQEDEVEIEVGEKFTSRTLMPFNARKITKEPIYGEGAAQKASG